MPIQETLDSMLKTAMKARDRPTLNLVRMLKSRMTEKTTAKGFQGEVNDALWQQVISAYAKSLGKACAEFAKFDSPKAAEQIASLDWEIEQLQAFLPKKADEATTRAWVEAAITGLGGPDKAKLGAIMGTVMKAHKPEADAQLVRRLAQEALAG